MGALVVALGGTLAAVFLLAFLAGRDPGPAWRRERAVLRRRLGIGGPPEAEG